jgi:PIN domain nuclease of toxin-antitoxin system
LTHSIEPIYVLDTHALLWHLTGDKKLSEQAAQIFDAAEKGEAQLVISVIVLAELYHLNQKRQFPLDFAKVYQQLAKSPAYQMLGFEPAHVLDFTQDAAITELHDRIISGLARRLAAPLVTRDLVIKESGIVKVVW